MSFPIIGSKSVWSNWNNFGSGAWRSWFMAPYGSWVYCGFVKSNLAYFKKIYIGSADPNYPFSDWDFGLTPNSPKTTFIFERNEGHPDGAMGCGCVRGETTPKLYLVGRASADPIVDCVIKRYLVSAGFNQEDNGFVPTDGVDPLNINHICGLEVIQGEAIFIATNNRDGNEFKLRRYAYDLFDNTEYAPTDTVTLSPNYMMNNTSARIRGIGTSNDGNIVLLINSGLTSTACKVLKFDKTSLAYLGQTTWAPSISTVSWGYVAKASEVFMLFQGLDSSSSLDWQTAIYYDGATGIPSSDKSNFIIQDNLKIFGSDEATELRYEARDAFNIRIPGVNVKFVIDGEDPTDSETWNDRVGGIQAIETDPFFDSEGVPLAIQAIVPTDGTGVARAYYKPMRVGSGTEIDVINTFCPSDN
jgi:hypothetical protein